MGKVPMLWGLLVALDMKGCAVRNRSLKKMALMVETIMLDSNANSIVDLRSTPV